MVSYFFKLKGKSESTVVRGTVNTGFVHIFPLLWPVVFFKLKGKSKSTAVRGTVNTHFVPIVPLM